MLKTKFSGYQDAETKIMLCKDIELIYPYEITLPDPPPAEQIINFGLPIEEQYFKRIEQPKGLIDLCKLDDVSVAKARLKANDDLAYFVDSVWDLWETGQWQYIRGVPTYITGDYLMYLSFNKINIGLPDYRSWDRDKFYWWEFAVKNNPYCFGGIEMTRRRVGKSFIAGFLANSSTIRNKNRNAGLQSKDDQSAGIFFKTTVRNPLKTFPFYLRPQTSTSFNTKGNKIEFDLPDVFYSASELESWIEYGTSESKYFDGRKLHFYGNDECGKNINADVYKTLKTIRPCLTEDEVIIGKALFTSTVEEMEKNGGANFKRIWDDSDRNPNLPPALLKIDKNGRTKSGLYQWFTPATHNYICDQYGDAIVDDPKDYQIEHRIKYLKSESLNIEDAYKGGKQLIDEKINAQEQGQSRQSEIRQYPRGIREAFRSSNTECHFNIEILNKRLDDFIYGDNPHIAYYNLEWKDGIEGGMVDGKWVDSEVIAKAATETTGKFKIAWLPLADYRNRFEMKYGERCPKFSYLGCAGSDTFKFDRVVDDSRKSMGTGYVYWGFDPNIDAGVMNDANWTTADYVCEYINRPPTVEQYCEDMLKMCIFYSVEMYPEYNVDHVTKWFIKRGYAGYLKFGTKTKKKNGVIVEEENIQAGAHTTERMKPTIFKAMTRYVESTAFRCRFPRLLEDLRDVDYHDLTPYDSFMGAAYAIMGYHEGIDKKPTSDEKVDIGNFLRSY